MSILSPAETTASNADTASKSNTVIASVSLHNSLTLNCVKPEEYLVSQLPPPAANEDGRYSCWFCPKTYTQPKHVRRHMVRHTGENPYKCETCSSSFTRPDIRKRHSERCKLKFKTPATTTELPDISKFITMTPTSSEFKNPISDLSDRHDLEDINNMADEPNLSSLMQLTDNKSINSSNTSQNGVPQINLGNFGSAISLNSPPHPSSLLTAPFFPISPGESASMAGSHLNYSAPTSEVSSPFDSTSSTPNRSYLTIAPVSSKLIPSSFDKLQSYNTDDSYCNDVPKPQTNPVSLPSFPFNADTPLSTEFNGNFANVNSCVSLWDVDSHVNPNISNTVIQEPFLTESSAEFCSFMSSYSTDNDFDYRNSSTAPYLTNEKATDIPELSRRADAFKANMNMAAITESVSARYSP